MDLVGYDQSQTKSEHTKKNANPASEFQERSESRIEESKTVKQISHLRIGESAENLPLVKQRKIISGKEYTVNAVCDFQNNQVVIKAIDTEGEREYSMYVEWD